MPQRKQHEGHQTVSSNKNKPTASSTTAGKLQRFYTEHRTPSATPAAAATITAGRLCGSHKFKRGDDVFQHFAQNGLDAAPKLVHCLQTSAAAGAAGRLETGTAGPYDLTVVPRAQLPACYCTLTATGVVQVTDARSGAAQPSNSTRSPLQRIELPAQSLPLCQGNRGGILNRARGAKHAAHSVRCRCLEMGRPPCTPP